MNAAQASRQHLTPISLWAGKDGQLRQDGQDTDHGDRALIGNAYAEFARLGGERRTEATGLGSGMMFAGVMLIPSLASLLATRLGGYDVAYGAVAAAAAGCGLLLMRDPESNRSRHSRTT